jgi:alanine racemase
MLRSQAPAATLTVDLGAVVANWRTLGAQSPRGVPCAAVVKADAYGLGAAQVAQALYRAGCRHFFVALLDEALALRPLLPADAQLFVLHGPLPGAGAGTRPFAARGPAGRHRHGAVGSAFG